MHGIFGELKQGLGVTPPPLSPEISTNKKTKKERERKGDMKDRFFRVETKICITIGYAPSPVGISGSQKGGGVSIPSPHSNLVLKSKVKQKIPGWFYFSGWR